MKDHTYNYTVTKMNGEITRTGSVEADGISEAVIDISIMEFGPSHQRQCEDMTSRSALYYVFDMQGMERMLTVSRVPRSEVAMRETRRAREERGHL